MQALSLQHVLLAAAAVAIALYLWHYRPSSLEAIAPCIWASVWFRSVCSSTWVSATVDAAALGIRISNSTAGLVGLMPR